MANGSYEAGYHTVGWNADGVSSGVYFARFTATGSTGEVRYSAINKLVVMK